MINIWHDALALDFPVAGDILAHWHLDSPLSKIASQNFSRNIDGDIFEPVCLFQLLFIVFIEFLNNLGQGNRLLRLLLNERNLNILDFRECSQTTFL